MENKEHFLEFNSSSAGNNRSSKLENIANSHLAFTHLLLVENVWRINLPTMNIWIKCLVHFKRCEYRVNICMKLDFNQVFDGLSENRKVNSRKTNHLIEWTRSSWAWKSMNIYWWCLPRFSQFFGSRWERYEFGNSFSDENICH